MCFSLASVVHLVIVVALKLWSGRRYGCRRLVLSPGVAWRRTLLDRCRKDNSCAYVVFNALSITALAMRCRRCRRFHHHFHYVGKHCRFQGCTGVLTRRVFVRRAVGASCNRGGSVLCGGCNRGSQTCRPALVAAAAAAAAECRFATIPRNAGGMTRKVCAESH